MKGVQRRIAKAGWWGIIGIVGLGLVIMLTFETWWLRPSGPQITSFYLSDSEVLEGEAITANWKTVNATRAWLNGEPVPLSGALTFVPQVSGTYTVVLNDDQGQQVEWKQDVEVHIATKNRLKTRGKKRSSRVSKNLTLTRSHAVTSQVPSMDIISATPRLDLSLDGILKGTDGSVWYLRQIDETIWGVSFSADQGLSRTAVLKATQLGEVIHAFLIGVPRGKQLDAKEEIILVDLETQELLREGKEVSSSESRLSWISNNDPLNLETVAPPSQSALTPTVHNLTGVWWANDGGMYYIQQTEKKIWGLGVSANGGRTFTTVFQAFQSGDVLEGKWIDLPKGTRYKQGQLNLHIIDSGSVIQLQPTNAEGGFSGTVLEPIPTSS